MLTRQQQADQIMFYANMGGALPTHVAQDLQTAIDVADNEWRQALLKLSEVSSERATKPYETTPVLDIARINTNLVPMLTKWKEFDCPGTKRNQPLKFASAYHEKWPMCVKMLLMAALAGDSNQNIV